LRFGHAQAAFMSAWPAQLAVKHARAEVALAEVREVVIGQEKKAETYYFSYWVVAKDSPVQRLEQLRGKRAVFPSPLSTSGYVAPLARLGELGLGQPQHRGLMRKLVSGIFVGFKATTAEQHLAALDKFLAQTQLAFVERLH